MRISFSFFSLSFSAAVLADDISPNCAKKNEFWLKQSNGLLYCRLNESRTGGPGPEAHPGPGDLRSDSS